MKKILLQWIRYFLPFFVLSSIFLFLAYLIVMLRMFDVETNIMPDLTGKSYINIHNEIQKYNLRVEIRRISVHEKPNGMILQQSIPPGAIVKPKDRLVLIVNNYEPILTMPKLINLTLENAKKIISAVPYDDEVYPLKIARIIYVYKPELSPGIVLFQTPSANTRIRIDEKIILIVSSLKKIPIRIETLKGLDIGIVSQFLIQQKIPYMISNVISTTKMRLHGVVKDIKVLNRTYDLSVFFYKAKPYSFFSDYEMDTIPFKRDEHCSIYISRKDLDEVEKIQNTRLIWFSEPDIFSRTKFPLIFYRIGKSYLYLICNQKILIKRSYIPDLFA